MKLVQMSLLLFVTVANPVKAEESLTALDAKISAKRDHLLDSKQTAPPPLELKLWPKGVQGELRAPSANTLEFIHDKAGKGTIADIHDPSITVCRPQHCFGIGVVVVPGGGYAFLEADKEGAQVCEWLSKVGITAALLKYRTPTRDDAIPHEKPLQDAARAIALMREHATEWNVASYRIGLLGFGAGGNSQDWSVYPANYELVQLGMPNFGIMIRGSGFTDAWDAAKLKTGLSVPTDAPPLFIACLKKDVVGVKAATALQMEYEKHHVPFKLHLGAHEDDWRQPCIDWIAGMGSFMNAETLKKEIVKREQGLQDLIRFIQHSFPCGNDAVDAEARLKAAREELVLAQKAGNKEGARKAEAAIKKEAGLLEELRQPVIQGINVETISQHIHRVKKEKLELEAELQKLESRPTPTQP